MNTFAANPPMNYSAYRRSDGSGPALRRAALAAICLLLNACGSNKPTDARPAVIEVNTSIAVLGSGIPVPDLHGVIVNRHQVKLSFKTGGVISGIFVDAGDTVRRSQKLAEIEPTEIDAQIVAPSDGVILARIVDASTPIAPGQPVLLFSSLDKPQVVRSAITAELRRQVRKGDLASVTVDALPGTSLAGSVRSVGNVANATTGLFPIEVELRRNTAALVTGMEAQLSLIIDRGVQRVRVPLDAVFGRSDTRAWLFVVQDGVARRREVEVAFTDKTEIAIASGLYAGETVVTSSAASLNDGQRVVTSGVAPESGKSGATLQ